MNTKEEDGLSIAGKDVFLLIDGLDKLLIEYNEIIESEDDRCNHAVLFYGDTGCGKSMFSSECVKKVQEKIPGMIIIDLLEQLKGTNYDSDKKLNTLLEIIEYEITREKNFSDLKEKSKQPELFKRILEKRLKDTKTVLLIRFPKVEIFEEFEKYYSYLGNSNTITYFITDKKELANRCKVEYDKKIKYFECMRLKSGDGKLFIENMFPESEGMPNFDIEDIESLMEIRPSDSKMTIKQLKNMCEYAYSYAQKNKIDKITKSVIIEDLFSRCKMI